MTSVRFAVLWLSIGLLFLAGCGGQESVLTSAVESPAGLSGWAVDGEMQIFDAETIYDLVNGQADSFFAYGFEQVAVQKYEGEDGTLRLEVWQLATPTDAYGLFTSYRSGQPVSLGQEGDGDPGRRLDFWQDRYFVRLFAVQPISDESLRVLGEAVSAALPVGGEQPALVERLPREGLVERSDLFFHQEISIQSYVWLGGQNLLGLSAETEGLLARYETESGSVYLLLVQYPDQGAALLGLQALQAGSIADLSASQVQGELLGAVFGEAGELDATLLLERALVGG